MKISSLVAASVMLLLAGCVSTRQLPDEANPALMIGEASYLATRCPNLRQQRQKDALIVACLLNKANGINCQRAMERRLLTDLQKGVARARDEFESRPDPQVCRIASERYGKSGSRFKNMLVPK